MPAAMSDLNVKDLATVDNEERENNLIDMKPFNMCFTKAMMLQSWYKFGLSSSIGNVDRTRTSEG